MIVIMGRFGHISLSTFRELVRMSYIALAHGPLKGLDYRANRPFKDWRRPEMLERIEEWLGLDPPRLELATLALDELNIRGLNRAHAALPLFVEAGIPPIGWLPAARRNVLEQLRPPATRRGRGRLYVILRDGYTESNGHYGAYVGVTGKRVEDRFVEHRRGIRAGRGLKHHGIELLYSLFAWANPIPGGSLVRREYETRLHRLLEAAIPNVSGDVITQNAMIERPFSEG